MEDPHLKEQQSQQASSKYPKIAKSITNLIHNPKRHSKLSKKHIDRYLYTFAFQVGTDLPSDEMLRNIYLLLLGNEEEDMHKQVVQDKHFNILVQVCLGIGYEAKRIAIGGIFQRVIMGLKQALYYNQLHSIRPLQEQ